MAQFIKLKQINFKKLIPLCSIILTLQFGYAQEVSEEFTHYSNKFPNAHQVKLIDETKVYVSINKNGEIDIKQEFLVESLYLDESATYNSKESVNFSAFFELEEIKASSFTFEKGKYRETKVEEFTEKDDLDNSFYDDTKTLSFIFPKLRKGSKSRLWYTEKVKNPRFLSTFYFGDFTPVAKNKVTLIADKDISFRFQEFNTKDHNIIFSKKEKKGNVIYTWELNDLDKFKYEANVPTYKNVFPHIVPIITSYKVNGQTKKLLGDVDDLYGWYYSLVKDVNQEPSDEELIALVGTLTKDKTNDLDKVKAIYYWTQKNIKYIDFEYALGGFIPREANAVYQKKYGDCKDNSSILFKMLSLAGLKGNLTWIGTRSIPYSYNEVPTPIVDNHMILSYKYNDKTYFLDATGRFIPIDLPTSFIQGKEALISNGENSYVIETVPVIPPEKSTYKEVSTLSLDKQNLKGTTNTSISGYIKINMYNTLENITSDKKLSEYYNSRLRKGNNKFLAKDVKETNKYDYENDFTLDYDFIIDDYAKKLGDEVYINLNLNKTISYYKTEEDRENDIEYKFNNKYVYINKFSIPEGYTLDYLPENTSLENDFITSNITYTIKDDIITYTHSFKTKNLTLNKEQQKQVNSLIKKTEKAFKEIIILKVKK